MKMGLLGIGMSVVMSTSMCAIYQHALPSYKKSALIAGVVAATYGILWFHDYCTSCIKFFDKFEPKLSDESKIYNWRLDEYPVNKPIVIVPKSSPHDHESVADGRKNVIDFNNLLNNLTKDYRKFNCANAASDTLYLKIQEEKKELLFGYDDKEGDDKLGYIDQLVKATTCFFNWYNIRKTYKHLCIAHLTSADINIGSYQPIDQTQWSYLWYTKMQAPIACAAQTNAYHVMIGKITHGRIARLYWQFLTRYYRLEKIEYHLRNTVSAELKAKHEAALEQIKEKRKKSEEIEDQMLSSWLYKKAVKPVREWFSAFFAS